MKQSITIIGGTGGFGKWLALFIMKHFGKEAIVTITGRNKERGDKCAQELGAIFSNDNIESVRNADVTIFAVPIAYMEQTIKEVAPHLKGGSTVADICSIKGFSSEALKLYSPEGVLVVPVHPMFGPFIQTIAGQIFVLTVEEIVKEDSRYQFFIKFLRDSGARVLETTSKEHDKMMAVVQGLTHFDVFVFGETIKRLGVDIDMSLNFVSPIYKIMLSSVARYMNHNPGLYGEIQMYNNENLKVHNAFIEVSKEFNKYVEHNDKEGFISTIEGTQKYFGDNALKGQTYTDKIIFLLSKQVELLKNNIGKELSFENIKTGKVISEVVNKYEQEIIYLENGEELVLDEWRVF